MADIHRLPGTEEAERAASEWIALLNATEVSAEDRAEFEAWRAANPRHAHAYEEVNKTWRRLTDAGRLVRAVSLGQALSVITPPPRRSPAKRAALISAAALLLVAIGTWWWVAKLAPQTVFQTAIGEHATVELPDASSLELNSNSLARVEYNDHARVIRLEQGEAFFKVQHDTRRPFWVAANGCWVRAVGTAFNVYIRSNGVEVTVSEGTVKVADASDERYGPSDVTLVRKPVSILTSGQQVTVHGHVADVRALPPVELTRSVAWRTGNLYFENERLDTVVQELQRYTQVQLNIENDSLRALPIGGTFQASPRGVEALLGLLRDGFGLEVDRSADAAYIRESTRR
jgi:transmembrane sensor